MPTGDALLKKPNIEKYRHNMEGMDRRAEEVRIRIHENIQKKKGVFMGASIGSTSKTYRESITDNIE